VGLREAQRWKYQEAATIAREDGEGFAQEYRPHGFF
jgi:hypothetical protein